MKVKIKIIKPPISHVNQLPYYYVFFNFVTTAYNVRIDFPDPGIPTNSFLINNL